MRKMGSVTSHREEQWESTKKTERSPSMLTRRCDFNVEELRPINLKPSRIMRANIARVSFGMTEGNSHQGPCYDVYRIGGALTVVV